MNLTHFILVTFRYTTCEARSVGKRSDCASFRLSSISYPFHHALYSLGPITKTRRRPPTNHSRNLDYLFLILIFSLDYAGSEN